MSRTSHSSIEKYKTCSKMWEEHYINKIREKQIGSPLFFGGAIDSALNSLLLKKKKILTEEEKEIIKKTPYDLFDDDFSSVEYNREKIDIVSSLTARYSMADFDGDILEKEDIELLRVYLDSNGYENSEEPIQIMSNIKKYIRNHSYLELDEIDKTFYAYTNWLSLRRKGHMMIKSYEEQLMPKIHEVVSIQKKIELDNGEGDTIVGYIDFEAVLYDNNGQPEDFVTVCDNKTSSRAYKDTAIKEGQQLTIYCEAQGLDNAAYFVLNKKVRKTKEKTCQTCGTLTTRSVKTCPEGGTGKNRCNGEFDVKVVCSIDTQVIKDSITEEQKDETFNVIENVLVDINKKVFKKNDKSDCFHFGRKCPYYERCWDDSTSLKGLVNLNK